MKARVVGLPMILAIASGALNKLPMPSAPPAPCERACAWRSVRAQRHGRAARCAAAALLRGEARLGLFCVRKPRLELLVAGLDLQAALEGGKGLRVEARARAA
jgi:hypothetical protein